MMKHIASLQTTDLPPGTMKPVDIDGRELLLAAVDGNIYAMLRTCTHMGWNLCEGRLDGKLVTCPRHGARFDVTTGQAVGKAKLLFMSTKPGNLTTFPVTVEGTKILIDV
jgi:3-phenylpropionate/trans-cinnamate dioxygenase ferredoxin subunit